MSQKPVVVSEKKQQGIIVETSRRKTVLSKIMMRLIGVIGISASLSVFVQGVPLLFVFLGGIMGIPADAGINNMNTMIWLLTCVTMMILVLYGFIAWMKYLWVRFMIKATPIHIRRN